jgi:hypothetical protein
VNLGNKILELNASSALIYSMCCEGLSVGGIIDTLLGSGVGDEDTLGADVTIAIKQFSQQGLLQRSVSSNSDG